MVRHIIPETLKEALAYLYNSSFHIMAGGTDLMIQKRSSAGTPPKFAKDVLYIANLKELDHIVVTEDEVIIGAATKLEDIASNEHVPGVLRDVIKDIGGPGIRHEGTLGGNIANASPASDGLVALFVLEAKVVLASADGERIVPIDNFVTGFRHIELRPNELIKDIVIPLVPLTGHKWVKVGGRRADSISKVAFAGIYRSEGGIIKDIRFAFGSVAVTSARNKELEKQLVNHKISDIIADLPRILEECYKIIAPIDDQRSNKNYRRKVATNIAEAFFRSLK